jgi:hypothetical protein
MMKNTFPNPSADLRRDAELPGDGIFSDLRQALCREVDSSAQLVELLQVVNAMQRAQEMPEEYKLRFEQFVSRSQEYLTVVRPFFPSLVGFLHFSERGDAVATHSLEVPTRAGFSTSNRGFVSVSGLGLRPPALLGVGGVCLLATKSTRAHPYT